MIGGVVTLLVEYLLFQLYDADASKQSQTQHKRSKLFRQSYIFLSITDPPVDVYSGGLLRSLRSSPQTKIIPAMRTHPSVGLYNGGLLRSLRSARSPVNPHEEGLLRSLRSGSNDEIHNKAILRSIRSGSSGDPYERGLLRSLRSAPAHSEYLKWDGSPQMADVDEGLKKFLKSQQRQDTSEISSEEIFGK